MNIATIISMSTTISKMSGLWADIANAAKRMWKALKVFVNEKFIQPVKDKLQEMKDWWAGFKEDVIIKWGEIKEYVNTKFIDPLYTKLNAIKDWWTGFKESVIEKWAAIKEYVNTKFIGPLNTKIEKIKNKLGRVWNYLSGKLEGLWDSLPSIPELFTIKFWKGLAKDAGGALGNIGQGLLDGVKWAINGVIGLINDLFSGINFSQTIWNPLGDDWEVGMDLSKWQIPKLAKGGIVNSPTLAMIGEAGPEAVVPLSGNNAGMGGTYNITVNAGGITDRTDKRALAREIGNMIQQELSRNTGGNTMRGRY